MRLVPYTGAVQIWNSLLEHSFPTTSDSKDSECPRLNTTKESRRENSEPQNLLCYKN